MELTEGLHFVLQLDITKIPTTGSMTGPVKIANPEEGECFLCLVSVF